MSRPEQGSATATTAVLISFVAVAAMLAGAAVSVFAGHRQVTAAADLAALAGAAALQHHRPGCPAADRIAARNHASLVSCAVAGDVVTVRVARAIESIFDLSVTVHGRARAGPADTPVP